jgi:uncharacterized protein YkwD
MRSSEDPRPDWERRAAQADARARRSDAQFEKRMQKYLKQARALRKQSAALRRDQRLTQVVLRAFIADMRKHKT